MANQTGIEKNRSFDLHKPNLTSSHFKKHINGLWKPIRLSWLPATLMMIRSKMNKLAWRHHFPIISLWEIFYTLRAASQWSDLAEIRTRPRFYARPPYLQV